MTTPFMHKARSIKKVVSQFTVEGPDLNPIQQLSDEVERWLNQAQHNILVAEWEQILWKIFPEEWRL